MSGSGSVGWTPSTPKNRCDQLSFLSTISSPQPAVIVQLSLGDELRVKLQVAPQTAVVVEYKGSVAGALTGTQLSSLINCLQNGYDFVAKVTAIGGGKCTVEVRSL